MDYIRGDRIAILRNVDADIDDKIYCFRQITEIRARIILKIDSEVKLLISIGLFFFLIGGIGSLNGAQALFGRCYR